MIVEVVMIRKQVWLYQLLPRLIKKVALRSLQIIVGVMLILVSIGVASGLF